MTKVLPPSVVRGRRVVFALLVLSALVSAVVVAALLAAAVVALGSLV
ncbi:hypothetical protein [Pseudonocardia lacus]|nr:hypothetical protein [Pseudonocardia lacus]